MKIKRILFAIAAGMMVFGFMENAFAMNFSPVEKIGVFAEGPHPTIARGYTAETGNSLTFGDGQQALTIEFTKGSNNKIGSFAGAFVEGVKINCAYLGNNIYRTLGDNGNPVYIAIGGPGIEQDFSIIAKHGGKKWHFMDINVLKEYIPRIGRLDYERAVYLLEPSASGDTITLPFGVLADSNRGYLVIGEFSFTWNDEAGWFGVEKYDY